MERNRILLNPRIDPPVAFFLANYDRSLVCDMQQKRVGSEKEARKKRERTSLERNSAF